MHQSVGRLSAKKMNQKRVHRVLNMEGAKGQEGRPEHLVRQDKHERQAKEVRESV